MPSAFNPTGVSNPVKKYIKWSGNEGKLQYWDKEKKEDIEVKMPLKFIKLEECVTITGYSEEHQSGIYSNEVYNSRMQELTVRTFSKIELAKGYYQDFKDKIKAKGGKYAKSVYAILADTKELVNIQFSGSSLASWQSNFGNSGNTIELTKNPEQQKKGATKYFIPSFKELEKDEQLFAYSGTVYNAELKPWLDYSMNTAPEPKLQRETTPEGEGLVDIDTDAIGVTMPF
jgi:inner membrane protein involved in colicin E2 resistance